MDCTPTVTSSLLVNNFTFMLLFNFFVIGNGYGSWLIIGNIAVSSPFGRHMCDQMQLVPQQKIQCKNNLPVMASVRDGTHMSIQECQHQFRKNRWNCSTVSEGPGAFGKTVQKEKPHLILTVYRSGSPQAAFVHAITSAGVTYKVTQACSAGSLEGCSCDKRKWGKSGNDSFIWGGCSDDVRYGMRFAERFIDASETQRHDGRARMNIHNNRVGRRAVKKFMKRQCKCHGPTASCPTRTCWDMLDDFRKTGDYLKSQYNKATQVSLQQDGSLMRKRSRNRRLRQPNKERLIYLEPSPNYCERNLETGSLGTSGRECNRTSKGDDGCSHVCCGRGYDTKRVIRSEKCNCKFIWCCKVVCEMCTREIDVHTCKPEVESENGTSSGGRRPRRRRKDKRKRKKGNRRKKNRRRNRNPQVIPVRQKRHVETYENSFKDYYDSDEASTLLQAIPKYMRDKLDGIDNGEHSIKGSRSISEKKVDTSWTWWERLWSTLTGKT